MSAITWLATQLNWEAKLTELRTLERQEIRSGRPLGKAA